MFPGVLPVRKPIDIKKKKSTAIDKGAVKERLRTRKAPRTQEACSAPTKVPMASLRRQRTRATVTPLLHELHLA